MRARVPLAVGFTLLLLLAVSAALAQESQTNQTNQTNQSNATASPPPAQAPPSGGHDGALPKPEKTPSAERGKTVYERGAVPACATCHAASGDGSKFAGPPRAADFRDLNRFSARSDADLWDVITNGKPKDRPVMPAFKDLTDQQKWDLIAYIRTTFMYQSAGGTPQAEGVHLRAYWLGLIGILATFLLMAVSFAVVRFTKKR